MSEANLWKWLEKARKVLLGNLHLTRQENLVMVGQPDVEGCFEAGQFWLELKHASRPARSSTKLRFGSPIKQNQIDWHAARSEAGGTVYYLISVGSGPDRAVYLVDWWRGKDMLAYGVTETELRQWNRLDNPRPDEVVQYAAHEARTKI